jgi:putative exporter of polyketide antibiotics
MRGFWDSLTAKDIAPIIGGAVAALPTITSLFQSPATTTASSDPNAYSKDLQAAIALKTQAAIAAQQAQAVQQQSQAQVQIEQIKASSTSKMLIFGGVAIGVAVVVFLLVKRSRRKEEDHAA